MNRRPGTEDIGFHSCRISIQFYSSIPCRVAQTFDLAGTTSTGLVNCLSILADRPNISGRKWRIGHVTAENKPE